MEIFIQLLNALWKKDFEYLSNPSVINELNFILFMILFLENGLLPTAFLPGDSLLILVGVLCSKNIIAFPQTIILLTVAANLGYWISYLQGKWFGNTQIMKSWFSYLPNHYYQRAYNLFYKYCLLAVVVGRFISFVRTLLPTIIGISGFNNFHFQFFNWISGLLWVFILTTIGYMLGKTIIFIKYEDQLIFFLILLPLLLLIFGIIVSLIVLWKKRFRARN